MSDNTVEILSVDGDDTRIACAAWTSTSSELTEEHKNRIPQFIAWLYKQGHHTPFEHVTFRVRVVVDVATHIQLLKHRIGVSINSQSARYKERKEDQFLMPDDAPDSFMTAMAEHNTVCANLYHYWCKELTGRVGRQRAKELARYFLPYSTQIESVISFNMRSFAHFYNLRASKHAQREICQVAYTIMQALHWIENNPLQHTLKAIEEGVSNEHTQQ